MQTLKLIVLFVFVTAISCAQKSMRSKEKVRWMTLEEVATSMQKEKRPILIDLYTDWCGWCKVMDKKTYANKNVAEYVQQKFYPVKIDAESKKDIIWNGKRFVFNPGYKTNEFAIFLTGGQLSYPTTVIIPIEGGGPQPIPGYLEPADFELVAKYFGEGHFSKTSFDQFQQKFKSSW